MHGLSQVAERARQSGQFWSDPEAGPWASVIASDQSFAKFFVRQNFDRYLKVVEQSRDQLFNDTLPSGVTSSQLMTIPVPAFVMPGDDALHATSAAHVLRELMPHAKISPLMPRQQTAASIGDWVYESAAACDQARPAAVA